MYEQKINPHEYSLDGKQTSSMAVVSLVLGIASYFAAPLLGAIGAIITGNLARKEIRENPDQYTGEGLARWGVDPWLDQYWFERHRPVYGRVNLDHDHHEGCWDHLCTIALDPLL